MKNLKEKRENKFFNRTNKWCGTERKYDALMAIVSREEHLILNKLYKEVWKAQDKKRLKKKKH